MLTTVLLPFLLASTATAHFSLTYPPSRGENGDSQGTGPCGGLNTPSKERTPWSLSGDQLGLTPGHDSANTAVYLAFGDKPGAEDFKHVMVPVFLQVGYGTFCWNDLKVPASAKELAKDGVKATIQVVQAGHSGGGLYNCADIVFTEEKTTAKPCSNVTTSAEPATGGVKDNADDDHSDDDHKDDKATPSGSAAAPGRTDSDSGVATVKAIGGMVAAAAVAAGTWLL